MSIMCCLRLTPVDHHEHVVYAMKSFMMMTVLLVVINVFYGCILRVRGSEKLPQKRNGFVQLADAVHLNKQVYISDVAVIHSYCLKLDKI